MSRAQPSTNKPLHLDPPSYNWTQPKSNCATWRRKALAGERMWIPRPREQHQLYIYAALTLEVPPTCAALHRAAERAWRSLRFEVPQLMAGAAYAQDGEAFLWFERPGTEGVEEWVRRTVVCEFGQRVSGLEGMKVMARGFDNQMDGEQAGLFLWGEDVQQSGLVRNVQLLLNLDHQVTDGVGARIVCGKLLSLLAAALESSDTFNDFINWEESAQKLAPPWIGIMNGDQVFSGADYEICAQFNRDFIFEKMQNNPGLPLLQEALKQPFQQTHFITFTEEQSTKLLKRVKQVSGPHATITHLGHAAMVLAMLRCSPPPTDSHTLYSPCWLNGRRYLQPSSSIPFPRDTYVPICLSFAPVVFTGLQDFVVERDISKSSLAEILVRIFKMATAEYVKIKESKSVLPGSVVWMEEAGANMWRESFSREESLSRRGLNSTTKNEESIMPSKSTADPFFLSDGITEQYIKHSYHSSPAHERTQERSQKIIVEHIQFAANAEKNPIVRMSSWRDKITISGEWVSSKFDNNMIVRFIEDVAQIMLSILDSVELESSGEQIPGVHAWIVE